MVTFLTYGDGDRVDHSDRVGTASRQDQEMLFAFHSDLEYPAGEGSRPCLVEIDHVGVRFVEMVACWVVVVEGR